VPWEYSFSCLEYPLYLCTQLMSENSDFKSLKTNFTHKKSIKDKKKSTNAIFWETCQGHVLS
jgi:hypothetical protein